MDNDTEPSVFSIYVLFTPFEIMKLSVIYWSPIVFLFLNQISLSETIVAS